MSRLSILVLALSAALAGCGAAPVSVATDGARSGIAAVGTSPYRVPTPGAGLSGGESSSRRTSKQQAHEPRVARLRLDFADGNDGFDRRVGQDPAVVMVHEPAAGRIAVRDNSDRRGQSALVMRLPFPLTRRSEFALTARFGVVEPGNHRDFSPIALGGRDGPVSVVGSVARGLFRSRDQNLGQDPEFVHEYIDVLGSRRIAGDAARIPLGSEYRSVIRYVDGALTLELQSSRGGVLMRSSYRPGVAANDGFLFETLAIVVSKRTNGAEAAASWWVDDVAFDAVEF